MRRESGFSAVCVCITAMFVWACAAVSAAPPTHTISGFVQTAAGMGVEGVSLIGNNGAGSAVSGAAGAYSITVPNHWDGTITAAESGWLLTPASKTYSNVGSDMANENYIAYKPKISGIVSKQDGTPLEGATVTADNSGGTTTTDAGGCYELTVPYNWTGTLSVALSGYSFGVRIYSYAVTIDRPDQDFTALQPKISGTVSKSDGTPLEGATVTASNGGSSTATGADGHYEVTVPSGWTGILSADLAQYAFTPKNYTDVTTNRTNQNFSGFQPSISGYVMKPNGTGLGGAVVTANGGGSTITSSDGYYAITVPYGWSGTVSAALTGYQFTPKTYSNMTANLAGQTFSGFQPTISGSTGIAGATITVSGLGNLVSGPAYSITVPYGWDGSIEVSLADYHFAESPRAYSNVTANQTNQDFTPYQPTISGYVRKEDASGIAGAAVTANNGGTTTTTNEDGFYQVTVPYGWSGQVTAGKIKWDIAPSAYSYTNLSVDQTEQNFTASYISNIIVKADGTGYAPTIQAAIDIADDGDIVQVEDGTYTGTGNRDIDFKGKAITVRGNVTDPNLVVIDCQGNQAAPHRGFKFVSGEDGNSILEGFTVIHGFGPGETIFNDVRSLGGAIFVNAAGPTIRSCIIRDNSAAYGGGGICSLASQPTVLDCVVSANTSVFIGGGIFTYQSSPSIANCTIEGNAATSYDGGGIGSSSLCTITVRGCTIKNNTASYDGGGVYGGNAHSTISDCKIANNTAGTYGGGIDGFQGKVTACEISENVTDHNGGGLSYCYGVIENCTISLNSAEYGGGLEMCNAVIRNCTISGNVARYAGGAFYSCNKTIENCFIENNSTDLGGALAQCNAAIRNCLIINNTARIAGAVYYSSGPISNCTISGNSAVAVGGLFQHLGTIENCVIWGNSFSQILSSSLPSYSCIENWAGGGQGNISVYPLFADPVTADYRLLIGSPCINAGDPNFVPDPNETDIDGQPRVVAGRIDMGADEFYVAGTPVLYISENQLSFVSEGIYGSPVSAGLTIVNFGSGNLSWSVENTCDWLDIAPVSGQTGWTEPAEITVSIDPGSISYGLQTCQFQIIDPEAMYSPQTVTVNVNVLPPVMTVSQTSFTFGGTGRESGPSSQTLTIQNTGYDILNWSIDVSAAPDWLTVTPAAGACSNSPSEITITVDPTTAIYGTQNAQLTISAPDAAGSPQTVSVSLTVSPPAINVSPASLAFGSVGKESDRVSQSLTIQNTGYDTLYWSIDVPAGADWLTVSPLAGACAESPATVNVTVDPGMAEYGTQNAQLTISAPDASGSPKTVFVSLEVSRPAMSASQTSFVFDNMGKQSGPASQMLTIQNTGYDTLHWTIDVPDEMNWLHVSPLSGSCSTSPSEVTVTVDPLTAEYGTQNAQFTISAPDASGSPQTISVSLEVLPPMLQVNPLSVAFTAQSMTIPPPAQTLTIQNSGYDTLDWTIVKTTACDWLTIVPEAGQTARGTSAEVELSVNPTIAGYGSQSCQLTVAALNAANSPQNVTVTLDVLRPTIAVSPASFNFQCSADGPNTDAQTLTISNSGYDALRWQITENCSWLSIEPTSGSCTTESNQVNVTVNTAGLQIGNYSANLTITAADASNSPRTVPVNLHVYRSGERHVATEYPSIAQAVTAAVNGDHVVIHPGIYSGFANTRISINGKALTIRSTEPDNKAIVERTIISGAGSRIYGIGITGPAASSSVIDGLAFERFEDTPVYCLDSSPTVRRCIFRNNKSYMRYACISLQNSSATIENCEFTNTHLYSVQYSASCLGIDNHRLPGAQVQIRNCLISTCYNEDLFNIAHAPALSVFGGAVDISNCTIAHNYTWNPMSPYKSTCPGMFIRQANVTLHNSIVWANESQDDSQIGVIISDPENPYGLEDSQLAISHSAIQNGTSGVLLFPNYTSFQQYTSTQQLPDPNLIDPNALVWGVGNIDADPLFARLPNDGGDGWIDIAGNAVDETANNDYGDMHLKSQAGRFVWTGLSRTDFNVDGQVNLADFLLLSKWWRRTLQNYPHMYYLDIDRNLTINEVELLAMADNWVRMGAYGRWVQDDVTSPCIDAGDPADLDWQNELWPNGGRINMGAYGGTPEASMSPNPIGNIADLNHDDAVDLSDWSLWSYDWLKQRPLLDSDLDRDSAVDANDLSIFTDNWLFGIE